ncbi:uncharacterized protein LOC109839610 [Asparagus officinalis]|uniref:uncharacterized protein LOC109839610 n=1 Tax=Asparagus officinalis TaxID=4686 RepID=UPI00098E66B3|nr:uncharacterized protein LOC109839610 [Asparagus officinalis]
MLLIKMLSHQKMHGTLGMYNLLPFKEISVTTHQPQKHPSSPMPASPTQQSLQPPCSPSPPPSPLQLQLLLLQRKSTEICKFEECKDLLRNIYPFIYTLGTYLKPYVLQFIKFCLT